MASSSERPEAGAHTGDGPGTDTLEKRLREDLAPELEIVRPLGQGSMASVYLAREPELKRLVAVKVLSPRLARDERARARFEREAQTSASLAHPNIVPVYRVGRLSDDTPYMIMQYVKGRTLDERLRAEGPLPGDEVRGILAQVASALAVAHANKIVHRDVRPDNIFYEEATGRPLLADFGIAGILATGDSDEPTRLTRTGELIGKPRYMSPEQLTGQTLTERTDVYGLGLLGFELLTGESPYTAESKREQIAAHLKEEPRKASEVRPGVDERLDELLHRCLAKEPRHRPNASDVAAWLKEQPGARLTPASGTAPASGDLVSTLVQRRMPQALLIYGGGGWIVLQVIDQLVQQELLPGVAYRLALILFVTGLPAAMVTAWFHGKKGRQRFRAIEWWIWVLVGVVWAAVTAIVLLG